MRKQRRANHYVDESTNGVLSSGTYDEFMEASSEEEPYPGRTNRLTWRGEPSATFADWTIVVVTNELQSYTHHVHRSIICHGSRSSGYFRRAIANSAEKQNQQRSNKSLLPSTKVELDQRDVKNFPLMLDFIYSSPRNEHSSNGTVVTANSTLSFSSSNEDMSGSIVGDGIINAGNVVSLRHLAKVFEVESLSLAANKYIQKDLSVETVLRYLVSAHEYHDKRLFQSASRLCVDNFTQLDQREISKLPFHIFRILVRSFESFNDDDRDTSLFLSEAVCRFLEKNRAFATSEILIELSDTLFMPYIAPEAAIGFTAIIKSLEPDDAKAHWDALVRLCRRCAQTVVQEYGWSDFAVDGAVNEYLGHSVAVRSEVNCVDSLLFATSFAAALSQAQADYDDVASSQTALESMLATLYKTIDVLEKANDRKDRYMATQDAAIADSRHRVSSLECEVRDLKKQLQLQKQLTTRLQWQSSVTPKIANASSGGVPTRSLNNTPKRPGTPGTRTRTPPRPHHRQNTPAKRLELSSYQSEDPAIRDLISPSSMQTEIRGRSTKPVTGSFDSLEQMRSTSLA
ncbi:hypothetical protein ACA910_005219 [Epithemia clementina (nom. ined.)]